MKKRSIGRAELEVLRYIAEHHPVPVRSVADHFAITKNYARPTVLKMMERLREKGYLQRDTVDGIFQYRSVASPEELGQDIVKDFIETTLEGSLSPLVAYLVQRNSISDEDLTQLRAFVDEMDAKEAKNGY